MIHDRPRCTSAKRYVARAVILGVGVAVMAYLLTHISYPWNWRSVWAYRALFVTGFKNTLIVSAGAICLGLVIGLLGGLGRVSRNVFISELCAIYVEIFRGTPLLTQIYIFYFCVATVVHFDDPFLIGMIALAFFSGAYISEMVRAGIESVDSGQWDAALSSGLTYVQTMRRVILPQALRRVIPPVAGQFVSLIKDSSLLSVISVRELTKAGEMVNATTYRTFEAYLPLALLYLVLTYPLSRLTQRLERALTSNGLQRPECEQYGHGDPPAGEA